jgi:hypothetical protein
MCADHPQAVTTAITIAVVAVGMKTHIGPVALLAMTIAIAITAATPATIIHHPAVSTVTLRRDARIVMVAAMIGVAIMRETVVALVNMPKQGLARERLVTEEALSAEVESTKIVLSMIDTPVDNCDR